MAPATTTAPLDLDAVARVWGAADVLRSLGDALGSGMVQRESLADDISSDYLERLIRDRWGEDYEDNAEFHHAEARSHEFASERLRNLARDLDQSAALCESNAKIEKQRARDCEKGGGS